MTEVTHDAFESRARICFCRRRERIRSCFYERNRRIGRRFIDSFVMATKSHCCSHNWQVGATLNRLSPLIKAKTRAYFYIELTTSKRVSNWQNYMHIRIVGHVVRRASSLGVVHRRGIDLPLHDSEEDRCERTRAVTLLSLAKTNSGRTKTRRK